MHSLYFALKWGIQQRALTNQLAKADKEFLEISMDFNSFAIS